MQTGGTEMYCQRNSSGRPEVGSSPSNSQSIGGTALNSVSTRSGFKSSIAFSTCVSSSRVSRFASAKLCFHAS